MTVVREGPEIGVEPARPSLRAVWPLAAVMVVLFLGFVAGGFVLHASQPKADPWSGTKGTIEVICQVPPGTPITYRGHATDRDALRFSAPGHPFILVPYNPIGGYEHPIPGDIDC